jgi:hypothetical protein
VIHGYLEGLRGEVFVRWLLRRGSLVMAVTALQDDMTGPVRVCRLAGVGTRNQCAEIVGAGVAQRITLGSERRVHPIP